LTNQQQGLATRYVPLAQALARRMEKGCKAEREELESIAYMALVEAAQAFDPSYNVNFATYARCHIRGSLREFKRRWWTARWGGDHAHHVVFRERGKHVEDHGRVFGIRPEEPVGSKIEEFEAIEQWLRPIPGLLAAACRLIYVEGLSREEAAQRLGCSESYLSRVHRDAIFWLSREQNAGFRSRES
jgi:RNA polymerase sigma factor (sigma-70 family)